MIDTAPFDSRLNAALAMNGMDNATFASHFGPTGQQTVNRWRKRGKIGQPSIPKVRDLLPRTNIDWLQEGHGEPERLSRLAESSRLHDVQQSYAARLDLHTLSKAVRVITADEMENGRYSPLMHATKLLEYYDRLATGARESDLIAEVLKPSDSHGGVIIEQPGSANGR